MGIDDEPLSRGDFLRYSNERWAKQVAHTDQMLAELRDSREEMRAQRGALLLILDRMQRDDE